MLPHLVTRISYLPQIPEEIINMFHNLKSGSSSGHDELKSDSVKSVAESSARPRYCILICLLELASFLTILRLPKSFQVLKRVIKICLAIE